MRVLVTGSGGFLGRAVMPLLRNEIGNRYASVTAWSRLADGDLLSSTARRTVLERARPDVVVHMAWLATGTPDYELDSANADWAQTTVELAREAAGINARFIGIGSMIEDELGVRTAYASAKRVAAAGVLDECFGQGLTAWIRPPWIFDFVEPRPRVLSLHAQARSQGLTFRPDNPEARKDFIHVADVAEAIQRAIDMEWTGRWDITTGHLTSVTQLLCCYDNWLHGQVSTSGAEQAVAGALRHVSTEKGGSVGPDFHAAKSEELLGLCWG